MKKILIAIICLCALKATAQKNFVTNKGEIVAGTAVGVNLLGVSTPAAARFLRINSDGTVTPRTAAELLSDIGAQASGTYLTASNNLSDVASASTARNNILPSKTGNTLKVLRVNAGETDYELFTLAGGGDALTSNPLSQFAATTSAQLRGVISDENGTGAQLFDAATNPSFNNIKGTYTTTATAAGTTTLTVSSTYYQNFTGSTTQTVVMPDATTLTAGMQFQVNNNSTGVVTVNANGGTLLRTIGAGNSATFTVTDVSTSTGVYTVTSSVEDWSWIKQSATYTLTSTTSSQKLFDASTNGAFTVEAGTTYFFECIFRLSSMSATSGNAKFDILGAGTATLTSADWGAYGNDNTTPGTSATLSGSYTAASISTGNIVAAATGTGMWAKCEGIIVVNTGGTIIPSVALTTAAAAVVGVNTHFKIRKVGTGNTYGNFN